MELDNRVIEGKTYLDCFHTEAAKKFIGKECYVAEDVASFAYVDTLRKGTLVSIDDGAWCPYKVEGDGWNYSSTFILPCEWVKTEKKYRPYKDIQEFFSDMGCNIGDVVQYRRKTYDTVYRSSIIGTSLESNGTETVSFCNTWYTLEELFNECEVFVSNTWRPFGVLDE